MNTLFKSVRTGDLSEILASIEKCHGLAATIETIAAEDSCARRDAMSCLCDGITKHLDPMVDALDDHWHEVVYLLGLSKAAAILIETDDKRAEHGFSGTMRFLVQGLGELQCALIAALESRAAA